MSDILRIYSMTDAQMVKKATLVRNLVIHHLSDFAAFDPVFNDAMMADWDRLIEESVASGTDETNLDSLGIHTAILGEAEKGCIAAMRDLRYYASKAFAQSSAEWAYLNLRGLARARQSSLRLAMFLYVEHRVATALAPQLTAVGMTPDMIEALKLRADELHAADLEQELFKHERLRQTRLRIGRFNAVWEMCRLANRAVQVIYAEDEVKRGIFGLE